MFVEDLRDKGNNLLFYLLFFMVLEIELGVDILFLNVWLLYYSSSFDLFYNNLYFWEVICFYKNEFSFRILIFLKIFVLVFYISNNIVVWVVGDKLSLYYGIGLYYSLSIFYCNNNI